MDATKAMISITAAFSAISVNAPGQNLQMKNTACIDDILLLSLVTGHLIVLLLLSSVTGNLIVLLPILYVTGMMNDLLIFLSVTGSLSVLLIIFSVTGILTALLLLPSVTGTLNENVVQHTMLIWKFAMAQTCRMKG